MANANLTITVRMNRRRLAAIGQEICGEYKRATKNDRPAVIARGIKRATALCCRVGTERP